MKGTEPWAQRRFWICYREAHYDQERLSTTVRREHCCDCRRVVVVTFHGTAAALVTQVLWICTECAIAREHEDGPTWKFRVWPRYRHT